MTLARELKMTRRQLLQSMDSYELSMWEAYLRETNKPPEPMAPPVPEEEDQEVLKCRLKNAFAIHGSSKKKRKK